MMRQQQHLNGLVTLHSSLLDEINITHAFTTRVGGVSPIPCDSLNLASPLTATVDEVPRIAHNFRRLRAALNLERIIRMAVNQVHGHDIFIPDDKPTNPNCAPKADAIITHRSARMLTIRTADCLPILIANKQGDLIAAVHAGWRSLVAGIIPNTIHAMLSYHDSTSAQASPSDFIAAIGPAISAEHFEISQDVADQFIQNNLAPAVITKPHWPKLHIDLMLAARIQLESFGLPSGQIDTSFPCSYANTDQFFSHRRDVTHNHLSTTGRHAAIIAIPSVD
ncbi:peptidoglycan editing factor PgeF [Poriferisphaera sp. WC338]|uniref:peptidoglycan editing factor PgeF n=1 Tax=Poriferisphaera sp. WC338 TaxID=3425129 RepID=UPI003D81979F